MSPTLICLVYFHNTDGSACKDSSTIYDQSISTPKYRYTRMANLRRRENTTMEQRSTQLSVQYTCIYSKQDLEPSELPSGHRGAIKAATTVALDESKFVWTGDTNGHVEIWNPDVCDDNMIFFGNFSLCRLQKNCTAFFQVDQFYAWLKWAIAYGVE